MTAPPTVQPVTDVSAIWGVPLQAAGCPSCGTAHLVPAASVGKLCPACFAAALQPQPARLRAEPPELAVPFAVPPAQAASALDGWARQVWLRPAELEGSRLAARLQPVFLPMWLVDARVRGCWEAQAGFDYEVASTQESYSGGQWVTQRLTETRIRWEPRAGQVEREYHNVAVPALEEHARLVPRLGPFDTQAAVAPTPAMLDGAVIRVPGLEPVAAWPAARAQIDARVALDCQAAAQAQHIDQAHLTVDYGGLHWTQLLLPVYASAYRDDEGRWWPVLVNGQTGRVNGARRASRQRAWTWTLAAGAVAAVCLVLAVVLGALGAVLPLALVLAAPLALVAVVAGLLAPIPLVWAWRFNARDG